MRAIGRENIWFKFKGIRNDDLGVRMLSMPTRPHPARKGKIIDVPGTDGELWQDYGGYKRILVSIRLITEDNANIDAVNDWLSGEGDLIFGDEPDRAYHARITKEFSRSNRSQRLRGQEFTVAFDCEPYRYESNPSKDGYSENVNPGFLIPLAFDVYNPGTDIAYPLIMIEGEGTCTIQVGPQSSDGMSQLNMQIITVEDLEPGVPVYLDCAARIAYKGEENKPMYMYNHKTSGDWLYFPTGKSVVQRSENVTAIEITPRWRWL